MKSKKPFTVCMFSNLYPPVVSGSSTQCAQLACELARREWKVIVITARIDPNSPKLEVVDGVYIYRIPAIRLPRMPIALNFPWLNITYTKSNQRRILEILQQHPPDVIHLQNHMFDMAFHAVSMARQLKIPLAITVHTIIKHPNFLCDLLLSSVDQFLLKFHVIQKADIVICPDQIICDYVMQAFGAVKNVIIPYGISQLPIPDPEKMLTIRKKYDIREGPVILSLGHLHETRNRKELIEILPQLLLHFPNLRVLIVGDIGTHVAETRAYKLGVREHLILIGAVPHSEVSDYLGIADIEATWFDPSHPDKSLGIAAREAMATGKVIVTAVNQNAHGNGIFQDGKNVVLVELNDLSILAKKMIDLLENKTLRRSIGQSASQTILEHFSWDKVCSQTNQVYQKIIQSKSTVYPNS